MKDGDIIQVAHVVRDLDRAMEFYWDTFRIGPWGVYSFAPPAGQRRQDPEPDAALPGLSEPPGPGGE